MMTMLAEQLQQLGLPKNSAIAFTSLLQLGEAKANTIIQQTGVHRHLIYEALRDLERRKLVKRMSRNGVAHFRLLDAGGLVREMEQKHELAMTVAAQVRSSHDHTPSSVEFLEGIEGVDALLDLVIQQKKPMRILGANMYLQKVFPEIEHLWNEKRHAAKIPIKALIPNDVSTDTVQETPRFRYRKTDSTKSPVVTWIFGTYVAHIYWATRRTTEIILVNSKPFAAHQRMYFDLMWKNATPE